MEKDPPSIPGKPFLRLPSLSRTHFHLQCVCCIQTNSVLRVHLWVQFVPKFFGWPGGSDSKESACSAGDPGSTPGLVRSPGEGNGYPLQHSCLENPWTEEPGGLESMELQRIGHY